MDDETKEDVRPMQSKTLPIRNFEDVDSWETLMFLYNAALKEIGTKIDILNDEFQHIHRYNPIEHVKSRIKKPESIVKKLKKNGYEYSIENMVKQSDLKILALKDYMKHPKESGYQSYHMLVTVPIFLSDSVVDTKVEIQIRTVAQDFWASLEHKIYYKFEGNAPDFISEELKECAKIVAQLDAKMLSLNESIKKVEANASGDYTYQDEKNKQSLA